MNARAGFALSLLAACGIHAAILLVPRAAVVPEMSVPTVELDLTEAPSFVERASTPAKAAPTEKPVEQVMKPEMPPPSAPPETASAPAPEEKQAAVLALSGAPGPLAGAAGESETTGQSSPAPSPGGGTGAAPSLPTAAAPALVPPRPRAEILPAYPRTARRSGLEGVVKVAAMVDASGVVTSVEVFASSGHVVLDEAALEAIRRAIFAPALLGGTPVPCRVVVPIRFKLAPS
jgi:periplasmic protein TonB